MSDVQPSEDALPEEATLRDADPPVEDDLAPHQDELGRALKERDDYLDALRRLQAEFENYKKRVRRQEAELAERASEALVNKLLPVLDTIDLALAHDPSGPLNQVSTALYEVLSKEGLVRVDQTGAPFDPTFHDAVDHEHGEGDPEIAEVMRSGYQWKGRVLRPAMVKVKGS